MQFRLSEELYRLSCPSDLKTADYASVRLFVMLEIERKYSTQVDNLQGHVDPSHFLKEEVYHCYLKKWWTLSGNKRSIEQTKPKHNFIKCEFDALMKSISFKADSNRCMLLTFIRSYIRMILM